MATSIQLDQPRDRLPMDLATLHRSLEVGARVRIEVTPGDLTDEKLIDIIVGAGFEPETIPHGATSSAAITMRRSRTLADTVGPDMRLLICGLNPSLHAADAGVGFSGPGNRFWPAARAAGLMTTDRDPVAAFEIDRVGMTDLAKRATPRADALTKAEYRQGINRLDSLCAWLRPRLVCMVGLAGWRTAVDPKARPGLSDETLGDTRVWVMPSTSGLNAGTSLDQLIEHFTDALDAADHRG